jgi:hypothetical protein
VVFSSNSLLYNDITIVSPFGANKKSVTSLAFSRVTAGLVRSHCQLMRCASFFVLLVPRNCLKTILVARLRFFFSSLDVAAAVSLKPPLLLLPSSGDFYLALSCLVTDRAPPAECTLVLCAPLPRFRVLRVLLFHLQPRMPPRGLAPHCLPETCNLRQAWFLGAAGSAARLPDRA